MTFTRTSSGMKNYNRFYNVEAIIYIEGRLRVNAENNSVEDDKTYDALYYKSLLSLFSPFDKVKLKIVGSKDNVLDYHSKIIQYNTPLSYVIIDRDYDGILRPLTVADKIIQTYGYSWENDFWTDALCKDILNYISLDYEKSYRIFGSKVNCILSRLRPLNRANVIAKFFGTELFPINVKGGERGFNLDVNSKFPVCKKDYSRIMRKFPKYLLLNADYPEVKERTNICNERLVQGHFLEFMTISLLSYAYKISSGHTHQTIESSIIKNLAFNRFKLTPDVYLKPEVLEHYSSEFRRAFS